MHTKDPDASQPASPAARTERGRWAERLEAGYELIVEGAAGFRLVDCRSGRVIGEFDDTRSLFRAAVSHVASGVPPDALLMQARATSGEVESGARGGLLVDLAESALGLHDHGLTRVADG